MQTHNGSIRFSRKRCGQISLFLIFFLFSPVILGASDAIPEKIRVVYSKENIPFQFQNAQGQADGMVIDKWKLFSRKTGIEIEFIPAPWNDTLTIMKKGEADAHAGLFFNEKRNLFLDYGLPLIKSDAHILWDKRLPPPASLEALKAYRVGILKGDFIESWLQAHMPGLTLVTYPSYDDMMAGLKKGEIKVIAADTLTAFYYLDKFGLRRQFTFKSNAPLYSNDFQPAVPQGATSLLNIIVNGMHQISEKESQNIARLWASGKKEADDGALIIAIDRRYPPLSLIDPEGNITGLLVEMWRLWSEESGLKIKFSPFSWADSIEAVRNGKADIHSGLFKNAKRSKWLAFSNPIHRAESTLFFRTTDAVMSMKQLAGAKVGVVTDSRQASYLKENFPSVQAVCCPDGETLILTLLKGDVQAILHETMAVDADLNRLGLSGRLKRTHEIMLSNAIYAGVPKFNEDLLPLINEGFAAIPRNKLAELETQWIPRRENRFYDSTSETVYLTQDEKLFIANHRPLVFSEVDWNPLSIAKDELHFDGIIADYLDLITRRSGLRFEFRKSNTWADVLKQYENKSIDMIPSITNPDKIGRSILLSKPFVKFPLVIVTRDNVNYISDLSKLKKQKVAVGRGYSSYHFLKNTFPAIDLVQTDDVKSGLLLLSQKEVSAFIGHMAVVINTLQTQGFTGLKIAGEAGFIFDHRIGVDPQYPQAISIINKVLDGMTEQEHAGIHQKWMRVHYEKGIDYSLIFKIISGALIFFGVVLYWNRKLSREVNQRMRSQETVQKVRMELQQIFDNTHVGLLLLKDRDRVHRCNARTAQILGYDASKEMDGTQLPALHLTRRNFDEFGEKYYTRLARGEQVQTEYQLRKKDGTGIWCSLSGRALDPAIPPDLNMGVIWAIDDISEKIKVRRALRESEMRVKTILNAINTGTIIIDPENRTIMDVNPMAAQMIGLPRNEIIGRSYHQFICPDKNRSCPVIDLKEVHDSVEDILWTADGEAIPILKTVVPVMLDGKKQLLESFVDLSNQKKAENELQQNLRELERFYDMAIDREEKMIELKAEVNHLLQQAGQKERYIIR